MVTQLEGTSTVIEIEKPYLRGIGSQLAHISNRLENIEASLQPEKAVSFQLLDALADTHNWVVWGKVMDAQGNPADGVLISLFDQDYYYDDRLGTTTTNQAGEFCIFYRTEHFQDLAEANPDLYLKVLSRQGDELFCSETPVRFEAGRFERFDIELKGAIASQ
ncbi:MAG: hypothetical protein AAGM45_14570 [Cyanobacteria bacterium J06588_5]